MVTVIILIFLGSILILVLVFYVVRIRLVSRLIEVRISHCKSCMCSSVYSSIGGVQIWGAYYVSYYANSLDLDWRGVLLLLLL